MNWRPDKDEWTRIKKDIIARHAYLSTMKDKLYFEDGLEAGADAVLEALKRLPNSMYFKEYGWRVFIPDKEVKE